VEAFLLKSYLSVIVSHPPTFTLLLHHFQLLTQHNKSVPLFGFLLANWFWSTWLVTTIQFHHYRNTFAIFC